MNGAARREWGLNWRLALRPALAPAAVFVALGAGWLFITPWLAPARIVEGPLVQQPDETSARLVFYTTRPANPTMTISADGLERAVPVTSHGTRHTAQFADLKPATKYPYRINAGVRELASGTFRTNKPAGAEFTFAVLGDSGRGTLPQYQIAQEMERRIPDFVLHTGDLVYPDGERALYEARFFAPYRRLLAEVAFWPSLGNHDVDDNTGAPYREVFELPENGPPGGRAENDYWFDYASARIAIVDSNVASETPQEALARLRERTAPWLRDLFASAGDRWKFVVMHHPPYTAGAKYREDKLLQETLVPVLEEAGVDVLFCGHNHMYERLGPLNGVLYIVTGAGGANLYEQVPVERRPKYLAAQDNTRHSFSLVRISGNRLHFRQVDATGQLLDEFFFERRSAATQPAE